jgi:plasmid stabilization system protein ParE
MPNRSINYHRLALREIRDAILWYARRSRSAAVGFVNDLQQAVTAIEAAAEAYPVEARNVRWLRLKKYHYLIFFRILDDSRCQVVAVSHDRRRPRYWLRRLSRP